MRRMGAACCVAAKDRTIVHGPSGGALQRQVLYSPSWSFRRDNRVAGEETHANWLLDEGVGDDRVEVKSGTAIRTAFSVEEGSIRSHCQTLVSDANAGISERQVSDEAIFRNVAEVKESVGSPSISRPSRVKPSPLAASSSTSLPTSQNYLLRPNSTPSRCPPYSHEPRFSHQVPAIQIPESNSPPFSIPQEGSEQTRGSNCGSSDSWAVPIFSELITTRKDRWSFDSENSSLSVDKTAKSSRQSSDSLIDIQTCGVCAELLTKKSLWGLSSQKIVATNELAVVSILNCGHVYHAECLEYMTPEINKYDPPCLVCTYGERQAIKMSEKALKDQLDPKARKRSGKRVVGNGAKSNTSFDRHKHGGDEKGSKINSSSIIKKPFLKRHFSFSSNSGKALPENQFDRRKGVFWARSGKD